VLKTKPGKESRENKDDEPAFLARQLEHRPANLNHRVPSGKLLLGIGTLTPRLRPWPGKSGAVG